MKLNTGDKDKNYQDSKKKDDSLIIPQKQKLAIRDVITEMRFDLVKDKLRELVNLRQQKASRVVNLEMELNAAKAELDAMDDKLEKVAQGNEMAIAEVTKTKICTACRCNYNGFVHDCCPNCAARGFRFA